MATRLHNTKFAIDYGEEMYLGDKTGYATFAELVDLASDLADNGILWYAVGADWLEFSYEMADAMLTTLKGQDRENLQRVVDEAKQWHNECVRLELW